MTGENININRKCMCEQAKRNEEYAGEMKHDTKVIRVDPQAHIEELKAQLREPAIALRQGALVAFPTETVYGLGCNPFDATAVQRLFVIKGRPTDRPLILHVANEEQAWELTAEIPETARKLAEHFFPGPLTIVLPRAPEVPESVCGGGDKVGIRCPAHPIARELISLASVPVAAPSANLSGHISPTDAEEVLRQLSGRIEYVVDGGPTLVGIESTVIDLTVTPARILRLGAIPLEDIENILGEPVLYEDASTMPRYQPLHAELILVDVEDEEMRVTKLLETTHQHATADKQVALLLTEETHARIERYRLPPQIIVLTIGARATPRKIASQLYKCITNAERCGADAIIVEGIPPMGIGRSIMHRLRTAASKVVH